jgi:predicted aldo/keto reductase-like oxidoreductase
MPMSIEGRPDEPRSIATIHAALDAGVTLIDTADAYHVRADEVGHNESLIARALARNAGIGCASPSSALPARPRSSRSGPAAGRMTPGSPSG